MFLCLLFGVWFVRDVLYCTVLYCAVLCCTVLYCTVLYCTVLYCTVLYSTVLYVLYCTVMQYTVLWTNVGWSLNQSPYHLHVLLLNILENLSIYKFPTFTHRYKRNFINSNVYVYVYLVYKRNFINSNRLDKKKFNRRTELLKYY
jgi:hypothetical protein